MASSSRGFPRAIIFPLFIVAVGVVYLLDQLGIAHADRIWSFFWPAVFLYFGLAGLVFNAFLGRFWGAMATIAGVLLLLKSFGYHINFALFWPISIIIWGLWLMGVALMGKPEWRARWGGLIGDSFSSAWGSISMSPDAELVAIFSAVKRRITAPNFRGGKAIAVFGEVKIDLTEAEIDGPEAELEASGVFGAVEVRVPEKWEVSVRGAAVLGEYTDRIQQRPQGDPPKRLIIKGAAVFGSVVVKN